MDIDVNETISLLPSAADPEFVRFRDESRFWIQRVLLPIIGTVGVFGNAATILVLTRRGMRTSTNSYLSALAVADLIYLFCVLWLSLRHYPYVNEDSNWSFIYSHLWPYSLWLADATTNTSVWLTVTFTVERCIAIAYPIKGRVLCTVSRAKKVIIGVYLTCFTTSITTPFEWTVDEKTDPATNTSVFEIASSNLGKMKIYHTIYYWFTSITFVLLPLTLLIIFNSFLIYSYRQSQKLRRIMTARQNVSEREERAATREIKITSTLITVVIMFLVCQLPTAAMLIYEIFRVAKLTSNEEAVLRALGNIFNFLVSLNAACNFILYCALSYKYRRTFMATFCRCFYRPTIISVHSKAQIEGPDGTRFLNSRRNSSFTNRRNSSTLTPAASLKTNRMASHQKLSSQLQRVHTASTPTSRKSNCYVIALPVISENGSSDIFPVNSLSEKVAVTQQNPPFFSALSCHGSFSQLLTRSNVSKQRSSFVDSPIVILSSWPNIVPYCNQPPLSVNIPPESESRIRFMRVANTTKECQVTSCSV